MACSCIILCEYCKCLRLRPSLGKSPLDHFMVRADVTGLQDHMQCELVTEALEEHKDSWLQLSIAFVLSLQWQLVFPMNCICTAFTCADGEVLEEV